jgi:tetratricopeptide (TPR) repeat protein
MNGKRSCSGFRLPREARIVEALQNFITPNTTRMLKVWYLIAWTLVCPAQDKPAVPEGQPEPGQLQLERLTAPEALTTLVTQRRWDEVLKVALQGLSEKPGDPILHYWAGVARFYQRQFVQAVLSLRVAEKLGLDTAPFHEALGVTYYAIRQQVLFLQQMQAAIRVDPGRPTPYHYLGRYYEHDVNDYLKAISWFDKALDRDPGDFKSLHFRAFCFQMLGRHEEAQAGYEAAVRCIEAGGETFCWPYQKLAEVLIPTDPQAALQYGRKAVELEPAVEANHLVVAKIYERRGDFDAAIRECLEAARLKPNDPPIRYVLVRLYKEKGDSMAAAEQLKLYEKLRSIYVSK